MACFCRRPPTLKIRRVAGNLGRLYVECAQKRCLFCQWVDHNEPVLYADHRNTHPSRDANGYPLRGHDIARPPRDGIEMVDLTNEIVYPPELKGLKYTPQLAEEWRQGKFKKK